MEEQILEKRIADSPRVGRSGRESNAGPGEALISAAVAKRVPHGAQVATVRLVAAKGKPLPIEAYLMFQ